MAMNLTPSPSPAALTLEDFDFDLPTDLIAQHPLPERSASRLLHVARGGLADRVVRDLPSLLRPEDLLVFNDTRVIKARFHGHKATGGVVEALVERIVAPKRALAMVRASKSPKPRTRLKLAGEFECTVAGREGEFFVLDLDPADGNDWWALAERFGRLPLPPYIEHAADAIDETRYQTVFSKTPGAVAAPTAGLHFDEALLAALDDRGIARTHVTLHVGAGTFQPVRVANLAEHRMHRERYEISAQTAAAIRDAKSAGRRVVAVGTTSLRALESAALASPDGLPQAGAAESELFVTPGFRFRVADALVTNFHLPRSTLLMLVSAFAGMQTIRNAYAHAIAARYRFFSYGDAMLLERNENDPNDEL
jgi:S-adenosylmethionine:tRNA ribosyltransferase-isomerase